eukprot:g19167.t1
MDKWQQQKHVLDMKLKQCRDAVDKLDAMKRTLKEGQRDKEIIMTLQANSKLIKEATGMWSVLKQLMVADEKKKKKLDPKLLENRRKLTQNLGQEIVELGNRNRRVRGNDTVADLEKQTETKKDTRNAAKRNERREKRKRRNKGDNVDEPEPVEMTEQQQAFMDIKDTAFEEQDQLLDEISKGLDELMEIATDQQKELTLQKDMMADLENKIDEKNAVLRSSNKRLKEMLEETNGLTRWCPMLMCIILLLALVGYIFKMVQQG